MMSRLWARQNFWYGEEDGGNGFHELAAVGGILGELAMAKHVLELVLRRSMHRCCKLGSMRQV